MGSIDKNKEYAACMLATKTTKGDAIEIEYGPFMYPDGPALIRVCDRAKWRELKSLAIPTGKRRRVHPGDSTRLVVLDGINFHLSWFRAIEAAHGPLLWAVSKSKLKNEAGESGRFAAGYKAGKRVAMVAQWGL